MNHNDDADTNTGPLPPHAQELLDKITGAIRYWREQPLDDLAGPDYTLARLRGLATWIIGFVDCAGWGDVHETADAIYELYGIRDFEQLLAK